MGNNGNMPFSHWSIHSHQAIEVAVSRPAPRNLCAPHRECTCTLPVFHLQLFLPNSSLWNLCLVMRPRNAPGNDAGLMNGQCSETGRE